MVPYRPHKSGIRVPQELQEMTNAIRKLLCDLFSQASFEPHKSGIVVPQELQEIANAILKLFCYLFL